MRWDDIGLHWEDTARVNERFGKGASHSKQSAYTAARVRPPVPDTGWVQKGFPDLSAAKWIGLDTETKDPDLLTKGPGVRRSDSHIVGISVSVDEGSYYFPMRHEESSLNLDADRVLEWARDNLSRPHQMKYGANLLYDLDFLAQEGVTVAGPFFDVLTAAPLIDEYAGSFSLDAVAKRTLGIGKTENALYEWCARAFGGNADRKQAANIYRAPVELVGPYAEADAHLPYLVAAEQRREIESQGLQSIFDLETRLLPVLLAMRRRGVRIDTDAAARLDERLQLEFNALRDDLRADVDIWAAASIARLCDREGISYERTAQGEASFTKSFLENHEHPMLRSIAEMREIDKAKGTFVHSYIEDYIIGDRIYAQFHPLRNEQGGAAPGRFSSSNPNLQNVPVRNPRLGKAIRSLFIPDEGEQWISDDYSQIEYRLLAHYARGVGAEAARQRFRDDPTTDYHTYTAELTGVKRTHAKNINFGLVYGMGEPSLAAQLMLSLLEAKPIFTQYHTDMPFTKTTFEAVKRAAEQKGYITTLLGRRQRFPLYECAKWVAKKERDANPALYKPRAYDEAVEAWGGAIRRANTFTALNRLLQGSAADVIKKAMVDIFEAGVCDVIGAPLLQVHDELDWSVARDPASQEAHAHAREIMRTCVELRLPLIVDSVTAANWGEVK